MIQINISENILVNEIDNTLSDIIESKIMAFLKTCSTIFFFYINDECK